MWVSKWVSPAMPLLGSTPKRVVDGSGETCASNQDWCVEDTRTAAVRGGSVLVLAALAFAGVTIIFKD